MRVGYAMSDWHMSVHGGKYHFNKPQMHAFIDALAIFIRIKLMSEQQDQKIWKEFG